MSNAITGMTVSLLVSLLLMLNVVLIRVYGPTQFVRGIDWTRVSDPHSLAHIVSLALMVLAALVAGHGVALYAFRADATLRNACTIAFVVVVILVAAALMVARQRYQDLP